MRLPLICYSHLLNKVWGTFTLESRAILDQMGLSSNNCRRKEYTILQSNVACISELLSNVMRLAPTLTNINDVALGRGEKKLGDPPPLPHPLYYVLPCIHQQPDPRSIWPHSQALSPVLRREPATEARSTNLLQQLEFRMGDV